MLLAVKDKTNLTSPVDVVAVLEAILKSEDETDRDKEHLWVIGVNNKNRILYIDLCTLGILDTSLAHPREVFRLAIQKGVARVIVAHNHPSGDCTPSPEDRERMKQLIDAGKIIGIEVLDCLVLGEGAHYSFKGTGSMT